MKFGIAYTGDGDEKKPMRHNDGSMVIMQGERLTDDYRAVLIVPMVATPKRGQGWCTADPVQEAFAARIVEALNATGVEGVPAQED